MTKCGRQETRGLVAVAAVLGGWYVYYWFIYGGNTVMARRTVIHDARVVILGTDKGRGVMAHGTIIRRREVVQ